MSVERNGYSHTDKSILRNSESLLVNSSLGFYIDESKKLVIFDLSGQELTSQTFTPNGTVKTLEIGEVKISHTIAQNGGVEITIESETEISATMCSYRFPFEKKFEFEKARRAKEQEAI